MVLVIPTSIQSYSMLLFIICQVVSSNDENEQEHESEGDEDEQEQQAEVVTIPSCMVSFVAYNIMKEHAADVRTVVFNTSTGKTITLNIVPDSDAEEHTKLKQYGHS